MILSLIFYLTISLILGYQFYSYLKRRFITITFLNKTVWVTGASSGIGEYLTYKFVDYGANVIATARSVSELERVKNTCSNPDKVTILPLDLSNPEESFEKAKTFLEQKSIKVDILINNAGASQQTTFLETPHEVEVELLNLNLISPMMLSRLVLPSMLKEKEGQIVMINSVAGKISVPLRTSYCATKFGLRGFADSLRAEYADQGLTVTSIFPGYISTKVVINSRVAYNTIFGKNDRLVASGMPLQKFVDKAIRYIYLKYSDAIISKDIPDYIYSWLYGFWPEVVFKIMAGKKDKALQVRQEALSSNIQLQS